jgi:hypothetical protein
MTTGARRGRGGDGGYQSSKLLQPARRSRCTALPASYSPLAGGENGGKGNHRRGAELALQAFEW